MPSSSIPRRSSGGARTDGPSVTVNEATLRPPPGLAGISVVCVLNCAAMDTLDIAVRLGAATLVGVLLGLNRDLHGKSTDVRTLGLVCLGSALAVLSIHARVSRCGRDCPKRERPTRARAHHGGLRLGNRVRGRGLRDCAVTDRRHRRCAGAGYSRVRRAVRESVRPALAGATEPNFGSAAGQNACARRGDVKEISLTPGSGSMSTSRATVRRLRVRLQVGS
jgi:MgtC family